MYNSLKKKGGKKFVI